MGKVILENLSAILDGRTLYGLQRDAYKYTDAGVSVGFRLYDGSYLWNGDARAHDPAMIRRVEAIGVGSIVEGSDAEIPVEWLTLSDDPYCVEGGAPLCRDAYHALLARIDAEACAAWDEVNGEGMQS